MLEELYMEFSKVKNSIKSNLNEFKKAKNYGDQEKMQTYTKKLKSLHLWKKDLESRIEEEVNNMNSNQELEDVEI